MRKKAVGLLGNAKGWAKPIAFVEDTCVPPEQLADYIAEFRQLLDRHGLDYGMFGHVDAGVLHVRPALDLCDPEQVQTFKAISDEVVELTTKYGGLIWGEHGKGMRSAYGERFFGAELWQELRYIKTLFDPQNRLNPGKICTPLDCDQPLYPIDSTMRADFDRQIPIQVREHFKGAMSCNGNGLCFNFDVDSAMCPSMKVSGNRLFSPKGRASLLREWLRLLAEQNISPDDLIFRPQTNGVKLVTFAQKIAHQWKKSAHYDFSHEVKAAMDTCLACKACASQCPIKIDVPSFRAKFNDLYHQRYFRPLKDHIVANLEFIAPIMAKMPKVFNFFSTPTITENIARRTIGMVDLPALSVPTLQQQLTDLNAPTLTLEQLEKQLASGEICPEKSVLLVQDPFTSYYDAKVVADFVQLCQTLGFTPFVLPFNPTGKALHVKGFLARFSKTARTQAEMLTRIAQLGIAMVGVDPALTLIYREEYREILGTSHTQFKVQLANEWLAQQLNHTLLTPYQKPTESNRLPWHLFAHCTESTAVPQSVAYWQQIFAHFGEILTYTPTGCCGMAGTFGHETQHITMSKAIYAQSWQKKLRGKNLDRCLATGYSCRSQVKRLEHYPLKHPIQALLSVLSK